MLSTGERSGGRGGRRVIEIGAARCRCRRRRASVKYISARINDHNARALRRRHRAAAAAAIASHDSASALDYLWAGRRPAEGGVHAPAPTEAGALKMLAGPYRAATHSANAICPCLSGEKRRP